MASLKDQYIRAPDPNNAAEMEACMGPYTAAGMTGAFGSTDGVAVAWESCPAGLRSVMVGKCAYPSLGFNCTVNHARRFLGVSRVFPGATNDKTKVLYDKLCTSVRDGKYKDVEVTMADSKGVASTVRDMLWLICDGGYHRWRTLQCPLKFPDNLDEAFFSKWLESVRKDVECAFGILKNRFRCLKLPLLWRSMEVIENVFVTCCVLHNICLDESMELRGGWSSDERVPPKFRHPHNGKRTLASDNTDFSYLGVDLTNVTITDEDWVQVQSHSTHTHSPSP